MLEVLLAGRKKKVSQELSPASPASPNSGEAGDAGAALGRKGLDSQPEKALLEDVYAIRVQGSLRAMCADYEPGTIVWLERNEPLLYDLLTRDLPDQISELWNAHAPLEKFDAAITDLLKAH